MIASLNTLSFDTERLHLRPLVADDLKWIYELHRQQQINQYLPYDTWTSWDDAKHWFAKVEERRREGVAEQFLVSLKQDDTPIGTAIVFNFDQSDSSVHIGYVLDIPFWGKGMMSELVAGLLDALGQQTELKKIIATVEAKNTRSVRLLERLGFSLESQEIEGAITLLSMSRKL